MNSEDELAIESEIMRHDSEDEIDHGPVLRSLRAEREKERQAENESLKIQRTQRKAAKDAKAVKDLLEEAIPLGDLDLDDKSAKSEQVETQKLEEKADDDSV